VPGKRHVKTGVAAMKRIKQGNSHHHHTLLITAINIVNSIHVGPVSEYLQTKKDSAISCPMQNY